MLLDLLMNLRNPGGTPVCKVALARTARFGRAKTRSIFCAAVLLLVPEAAALAGDRFDGIRKSIEVKLAERHVPSIAVAVAQGDKILWEEGFGLANRERRIAATADTMYSLASISKSLTATALMTLVQAGKVDLDRPVNDYLGAAKLTARIGDARDATVRRIASHTAGLPEYYQFFYYNEPWRRPAFDETIRRYGNLVYPPGEGFEYSNLGYGVLSYVVSRVSGQSFPDYLQQAVFRPLGMTRTTAAPDPSQPDGYAIRYDADEKPIAFYDTDHDGASAVYASAHDLVRFGQFNLKVHLPDQAAILRDSSIDEMHRPTVDEGDGSRYGMGWETSVISGYEIVAHDGGMPGVRTELRLIPSAGLVVVALSNADDRIAPIVADEIMEAVLPNYKAPVKPPRPPRPPFSPPPGLVGVWKGKISTYGGDLPLTLRVLPSGEIQVELAGEFTTLLNSAHISSDGYLAGAAFGSLKIDDAVRRPYYLGFALKPRGNSVLNGRVSARADDEGVMPTNGLYPAVPGYPQPATVQTQAFILPQWAELTKQ